MNLLKKIDSFGRTLAIFLVGMACALLTSCGGQLDLVYNQPVETLSTNIVYRTGIYGFGYYDSLGRYYGPNNLLYGNLRRPIVVIRSSSVRRNKRTTVAPRRRGSGGTAQPKKGRRVQLMNEPDGEDLFKIACAICHVNLAEHIGAPKPAKMKLDLDVVKNGRGTMPAHPHLTDEQILAIFKYIKTLK